MNCLSKQAHVRTALMVSACFILITGPGCRKFLEADLSPNIINTDAIFQNDNAAIAAVSGVYVYLRTQTPSLANGTLSIFAGLSADEIYNTTENADYDAFLNNSLLSTNTVVNDQLWSAAYTVIYRTNAIIEGLEKSNAISENLKKQLMGEMKVIRSMYFFYLVNLFGDVPLTLSTDYEANSVMPRTANGAIYDNIITDLKDAKTLLADDYPSAGKLRVNKFTASALLARVYLYREMWADAEAEASGIIASGTYQLVENLNEVFLIGSAETIWEIAYQNDQSNTTEASYFVPYSPTDVPTFALTDDLLSNFETGDLRRATWIDSVLIDPDTFYYPKKYKDRMPEPATEYEIVFRLAEQHLIRAEARAKQNKLTGENSAETDINIIRARAGLPGTTATTESEITDAIESERRRELFAEWGHRWFDLKRTNSIDTVIGSVKGPNWQTTDAKYPVPLAQIQYNPFLVQNPGY